ncbi:MAG: ABC transporter ATP-binding protein [Dermabacter sp.]|nr:ABC transporter ATP-binding protein [Dermabacter sp.]
MTTSPLTNHPSFSAAPVPPVLDAQGLRMTYDGHAFALAGVSLAVAPGESIAVMGPSGCGKTTLLHVLAGILAPTDGVVHLRGSSLSSLGDASRTRLRRSDFGFVFQDGQLLPELTARENVMLPRMLAGTSRRGAQQLADQWLGRLGLGGLEARRPGQLSGGQAQRVAIARALAGSPSVVFADEPTGSLDQATGHEVLGLLLGAVKDAGASLVMVTHDADVAAACGRIIHMRDGLIESDSRAVAGAR